MLGATLWTDYQATGDRQEATIAAQRQMNDHRLIRTRAGGRWRPADALEEHRRSLAWLQDRLADEHDGPTLIVTHHVPHRRARNRHYPIEPLSASFFSNLTTTIRAAREAGTVAWLFGHHHCCVDLAVEGLRLLSAQQGYPREPVAMTGWTGPAVLEV